MGRWDDKNLVGIKFTNEGYLLLGFGMGVLVMLIFDFMSGG